MTIREIHLDDAVAPYDHQVVIENEDGSTLTMPKTLWDELEAQKELGGTL